MKKGVSRIRERAGRISFLRWMWRQVWRVKRILRGIKEIPRYLLGQFLYWRSYPYEVIGIKRMRKKYGHLYECATEDPLVSVIIPTYDRGKLLVERTLPPILAQTYKNFEIVIIGDHSPSDTIEWIFKVQDPRVLFHNLPRRGPYPKDPKARWRVAGTAPVNKALNLARGKWIASSDDDEVWTADHIETLLRFAQAGQYEFVSGQYQYESSQYPGTLDPTPYARGASTWLYRSYLRVIKADIHCWRYGRSGDVSRFKRMVRAGVKMGSLEHVVAYHLFRPGERLFGSRAAIHSARRGTDLSET